LINKFYNAQQHGQEIVEAWGDGSPTREFLYVDDLADACLFLMNNYDSPDHINVGSDVETTIRDLSEIIKREVGYAGEIFWNTDKPNGTPRRKLDNTKLFDMGWKPKVSFDVGLRMTIEWFKQNKGRFL
jgi:GDP-L-fucose synthase